MNVSWGHQKIDAAEVKLRGELRGFRKLKKKKNNQCCWSIKKEQRRMEKTIQEARLIPSFMGHCKEFKYLFEV